MAISLYVPSWIQYDLWYEAFFETLVKDLKGLQREHTSSSGRHASKGTLLYRCLMSVIEGQLPAQSCVLFIEHFAPARHTALCRDAAYFALL